MPIYEYECKKCGKFEFRSKIPIKELPEMSFNLETVMVKVQF